MESTLHFLDSDSLKRQGRLHPEAGELSYKILQRDLKTMKHYATNSFLRRPYSGEIDLIKGMPSADPNMCIEAIYVISVIKNTTNARIPVTKEMINDIDCLNLYRRETKGFG